MNRSTKLVAAAVMFVSITGCSSGDDPTPIAIGPSTSPAELPTSQQANSATSSVAEPLANRPTNADTTSPASGCRTDTVGFSAADTFDDAGLVERNSRFVPLNDPTMVEAADVTWLQPDDIIMGITHASGATQAYPVSQMIYHHVANTSIAGEPYVVTY